MVDHIKKSTTRWTPYEVDENPFKDHSMESLEKRLNGGMGFDHDKANLLS